MDTGKAAAGMCIGSDCYRKVIVSILFSVAHSLKSDLEAFVQSENFVDGVV